MMSDMEDYWRIDWVDNRLALSGSIPDYDRLIKEDIKVVVNVRAEAHDDIIELGRRGIAYFWIPIGDFGAPRFDQIKAFLNITKKYDKVLVHCSEGRGRAASMAAYYLAKKYKLSATRALEMVKNVRPEILPTKAQVYKLEVVIDGKDYAI
jgi:protein-tyrosine phosphatase